MVHYLEEKEIKKSGEVLKRMKREGCKLTIVAYSALIRGYVGVGKVGKARSVFRPNVIGRTFPDFQDLLHVHEFVYVELVGLEKH